ncbi:hypothetical protein E3E23_05825 [Thermococcus sp. CX2]|uniref:hypothetical protein n=1 Tax=Thermococcus sp. CX2 TaxID=163006 RepID=UPI001438912E|nr:hypothetical protein [Thermococcus sp. CX2]NJE85339.1 hypothetical protein [Thermococcus sp. CX2]
MAIKAVNPSKKKVNKTGHTNFGETKQVKLGGVGALAPLTTFACAKLDQRVQSLRLSKFVVHPSIILPLKSDFLINLGF